MNSNESANFSEQLRRSQHRYTQLLERRRHGLDAARTDVTAEAMQELATALEELRVAEEELRIQNAALLDSHDAVAAERERLQEFFEALPVAYIVTNAIGVIEAANCRAAELLGVPAGRLTGKPITVYLPESSRREFRKGINELSDQRTSSLSLATVMLTRDRQRIGVQVEAALLERASGDSIGWLIWRRDQGTAAAVAARAQDADHADRLVAERAGRRYRFLAEVGRQLSSERDVSELCAGVARAIVKYVADHCSIHLIEAAELAVCASAERDPGKAGFVEMLRRRFELRPSDVDGLLWRAMLTGEPQAVPRIQPSAEEEPGMRSFFSQLRESGPRNAVVLPLRCRDHSCGALVAFVTSPVPSITAEDVGILVEVATRLALAIENAQLMQKLERANREKSEFLAVVSHELRTPLTAVIGYAELLLAGIPDPLTEGAQQQVERIQTSAWHQLSIVEQLVSHARPGIDVEETVCEATVELAPLIEQVCAVVQPAIAGKGLALEVVIPQPFTLKTDAGRLRQILINLLWNAAKYTKEGAVRVGSARLGQ